MTFEPKIQAFLCRWCASAGADLAGVSRLKYPPNILPIQINCSGRLDPMFILRALEAGADGVFIGCCHEGDCHYVDGNIKMKKRYNFVMNMLAQMGLADRVQLEYVSASEGVKFQAVTTAFTERIRKLGPSPLGKDMKLTDVAVDEENRKKVVIHEQFKNIATAMKFEPQAPLFFPEDAIMEGYGFPKRDQEKCIGCYACFNVCPEKVITMDDVQNKRVYGTLSYACVDCKKCEKNCPNEALKVLPGFELMAYMMETPIKDLEQELLQCKACQKYFASVKHVDYAKKKISEAGVTKHLKIPQDQWNFCPSCKRLKIAQEALGIQKKLPSALIDIKL